MSAPFVDTDILIRLLTGDDLRKQAAARELFELVESGAVSIEAPDTVIADAVYVLSSRVLYALPRADIRELLTSLVRLPGFLVQHRRSVLRALEIYADRPRLDFGDAMIAASMEEASSNTLYSYDHDFDRMPGITRREP